MIEQLTFYEITVREGDTFDVCKQLIVENPHLKERPGVAFLNMAASKKAGGGVEQGCPAQEEETFRRSKNHMNLFYSHIHFLTVLSEERFFDLKNYC